jgi:YNFM family putative membrane transporter
VVVSTYAVMHGAMQLVTGPAGDRLGKYRMIAIATALCAVLVFCCGLVSSLAGLTIARLATGMSAAWIIPLGIAYIGDVVPYDRRQQVLGRYLSGQIIGQLFGQAAGGIIGDAFGWRAVFFVLAGLFGVAALGLFHELKVNPLTRPLPKPEVKRAAGSAANSAASSLLADSVLADYRRILETPWARIMLLAVFLEGAFMFGAFAYVGADLHARFGLNFTLVGVVIAAFGIGGLVYAGFVRQLFGRFGEIGLAAYGGVTLGIAYLMLAFAPAWWAAPLAVAMIGLGFYMLHNTLQTNATQMAPEARATGVCMFSARRRCFSSPASCCRRSACGSPDGWQCTRRGEIDGVLEPRASRPRLPSAREQDADGTRAVPGSYPRPRETRSISARTRRSTILGRLSSSQALSIGLSISRTRSSSVREFCTKMVWASELNAMSTAALLRGDSKGRSSGSGGGRGGSGGSLNTTSGGPSMVLKTGLACIDSVSSRTSGAAASSGSSFSAASKPASMASMSSWLFFAAGGAGAAGAGAGATWAGAAGGLAASSSAMIRRMEARISSIVGSWAFAG